MTFYNLLKENRLINPIWNHILSLIDKELDIEDKDEYLSLFLIYFSLIDSGNACISLDEKILSNKWNKHLEGAYKQFKDNVNFNKESYDDLVKLSKKIINDNILKTVESLNIVSKNINDKTIFIIEDDYLYLRKYYQARIGIKDSIDRIFKNKSNNKDEINFNNYLDQKHQLSLGQAEVIKKGLNNNLVVTGGPGTGKTTSVLYVLLNILYNDSNYDIKLCAQAGKAAGRMKESLKNGIDVLIKNKDFSNEPILQNAMDIIKGIVANNKVEEFTIHRLLSIDMKTKRFKYNKTNQFSKETIFVIDEASMIDLCLFNNLLASIPTGARVFILGDKNQLPSVDVGSVFSDLLEMIGTNNKVEIKDNQRFKSDSEINIFAECVKNQNKLPLTDSNFNDYNSFKIEEVNKDKYPIFYYKNEGSNKEQEKCISSIVNIWTNKYFENVVSESNNLDKDNITEKDLNKLFLNYTFISKIICAENDGVRGVNTINKIIKRIIYKDDVIRKIKNTSISNNYVGQLMMVNKNNRSLDLFNGDMGMLVTFKNDKTLYFMINKNTNLDLNDDRLTDKIFKIGNFIFYPFRLLSSSEIDLAYAITVHKSQGSDYQNILVILPTEVGHPLLNNQILYTAVTRTKGNTYILSNLSCLEEAINNKMERDTNIK